MTLSFRQQGRICHRTQSSYAKTCVSCFPVLSENDSESTPSVCNILKQDGTSGRNRQIHDKNRAVNTSAFLPLKSWGSCGHCPWYCRHCRIVTVCCPANRRTHLRYFEAIDQVGKMTRQPSIVNTPVFPLR